LCIDVALYQPHVLTLFFIASIREMARSYKQELEFIERLSPVEYRIKKVGLILAFDMNRKCSLNFLFPGIRAEHECRRSILRE
jgi:hypothetical protein